MQDKFTGKSRGFAFVTMGNEADAQKAITEFNGKTVEGRPLTVNEARPREARPGGGGGGAAATAAAAAAAAVVAVATAAVVAVTAAAVDVATAAADSVAGAKRSESKTILKAPGETQALFCLRWPGRSFSCTLCSSG